LVRFEELVQSTRILEQPLDRLPDGPLNVDDPRVILPPKTAAMTDMEAMIFHFKQVMEGVKTPVGEAYFPIENGKGARAFSSPPGGTPNPGGGPPPPAVVHQPGRAAQDGRRRPAGGFDR